MVILVTGGLGFIGSELVRQLIQETDTVVVNVDLMTYAGNLDSVLDVEDDPNYLWERADIADPLAMHDVFERHQPDAVIHLAAESHVDRSIDGPGAFLRTNITGTFCLLDAAKAYWSRLNPSQKTNFRFVHVSTDEVFGSLGPEGEFHEESPYRPNSPYSASKAASDHLARAWFHTYGLPTLITHCSNNYGHYQFPEKLIPLMILNALEGKPLPIYGNGQNVRDWLYVGDHVRAIRRVLEAGKPGDVYNIGGNSERTNLQVVHALCGLLDELAPNGKPHSNLITYVTDRPGHDQRYAVDASKIKRELGWIPLETFESGIRTTVEWYLANEAWCSRVRSGEYRGERLGLSTETAGHRSAI